MKLKNIYYVNKTMIGECNLNFKWFILKGKLYQKSCLTNTPSNMDYELNLNKKMFNSFAGTSDTNGTGRAVHMVTSLQPNSTPISGLTPIVVSSQGQNGTNLTHILASSSQLAGKVKIIIC